MCNPAHKKTLAAAGFGRCLTCPGASGRIEEGKMLCARTGATAQFITLKQAAVCDGKRPKLVLTENGREVGGRFYDLQLPVIRARLVALGKFPSPVSSL